VYTDPNFSITEKPRSAMAASKYVQCIDPLASPRANSTEKVLNVSCLTWNLGISSSLSESLVGIVGEWKTEGCGGRFLFFSRRCSICVAGDVVSIIGTYGGTSSFPGQLWTFAAHGSLESSPDTLRPCPGTASRA